MAKRLSPPTGYVIYDGPSLIDGAPIVCIATLKSRNGKTGGMLQTWILRADVAPMEASRTGLDRAICGDCVHRGVATMRDRGVAAKRTCYVQIGQAPSAVYRTWLRGRYPAAVGHVAISALGRGRKVRLGAYGDMSAVPGYVADSLLSEAAGHTAYSHQSGNAATSYDAAHYMVSADSLAAARQAWAAGARTFRVVNSIAEAVAGFEIPCPSLRGVHCIDCGLCDGAGKHPNAKSIVIPVHGAGSKHFGTNGTTGAA
jgi:hypothetical protein